MTTIGTFGTVTLSKKEAKKEKRAKAVSGRRFKCSLCVVATDSEDVITSHIISDNDCKASYYTDKELSNVKSA